MVLIDLFSGQLSAISSQLRKKGRGRVHGAAKRANEKYVEVGYEDKVVFTSKKKAKGRPNVTATWQRSQGLWADHPVFRGMTVKEVIEWLRGDDCDV